MTANQGNEPNVKKSKKMKKAEKNEEAVATKEGGAVEVERPSLTEPWNWFPELLEHWRPMIGRRMPELLSEMSLAEGIKVEECKEGDTVVIRAEIPGVDPDEDIDVSMADGKLTISARREQREETKTDDSFRSEFRYGSFRRTRTVPPGTKLEDVEATYEDGILEVRVPVDEHREAKAKISVTRKP